jgi:hypothetical protein
LKTVVYQSYRTQGVPRWIDACMASVRDWAAGNGYDYEFIDDSLFDRVPAWFREKAAGEICPQADLARLVLAREFLDKGYDRTVWLDADLLVFAPQELDVELVEAFAYCHEMWLAVKTSGEASVTRRVNNSVTVFVRGNVHLEFFIDACLRIAKREEKLDKLAIGAHFLTSLRRILNFPLLRNVGMFGPPLLGDIADGTDRYLRDYMPLLPRPLACANLCSSLTGRTLYGVTPDEAMYERVVDACQRTQGAVVNRFFKPRP